MAVGYAFRTPIALICTFELLGQSLLSALIGRLVLDFGSRCVCCNLKRGYPPTSITTLSKQYENL